MSKERKARPSEAATGEQEEIAAAQPEESAEAGADVRERKDEEVEPANEEAEQPDSEETIASLEQEIADLKDQLLRKQADFENFRKRLFREREEAIRYANTNLLLDLVEIIDNFERAIRSSEDSRDFDTFHAGVDMIEKQLTSMLESKYGLKRFESKGEQFNPDLHEAITAEVSPEVETQTVLEDFQKGYMLHDRVLRHAKVRVALPPPDNQETEPENTESED